MTKSPAFQLYAADFLVGVASMSNEEVGMYIKLLCFQWERGGLSEDELRRLSGSRRSIPSGVLEKFPKCDDGLCRNDRLELEREKQAAFRASRVAAGSLGGKQKASKRVAELEQKASTAKILPLANGKQNLALQSSSSVHPLTPSGEDEGKKQEEPRQSLHLLASQLYESFPKRVDPVKARYSIEDAIADVMRTRSISATEAAVWLLARVERYRATVDPQYVARPANWFRDQRYLDDNLQVEVKFPSEPEANKAIDETHFRNWLFAKYPRADKDITSRTVSRMILESYLNETNPGKA